MPPALTPVSFYHCQQLAEPFLGVRLTWSRTGLCVHSYVLSQSRLINEALPTVPTGKEPVWLVDALVPEHLALFPKVFITFWALERSFPCVQALVAEQLCFQAETLVTFWTLKRFLSRVRPDVFQQLRLFGEALTALTGKRHLPAVQQLVSFQVRFRAIALATLGAREGPLPCVQDLVAKQLPLQAEALIAFGALEGPLTTVHAEVLLELGPCGEALATLPA